MLPRIALIVSIASLITNIALWNDTRTRRLEIQKRIQQYEQSPKGSLASPRHLPPIRV